MRKLVFFDSWKGGIRHFYTLVPNLEKLGIRPILIHLSSWESDSDIVKEEFQNGLLIRDISFYNNLSFDDIIEIERPDLVLLLSINTFAHWAFVRLCNHKNIPTVHLFCGLINVQAHSINHKGSFEVNLFSYLKKIYIRLPRFLKRVIPCYLEALWDTHAGIQDWYFFIKAIYFSVVHPAKFKSLINVKANRCLIYANADKAIALGVFNYLESEISAVGNPDFDELKPSLLHASRIAVSSDSNQFVLYIDTGLLASGYYFEKKNDFLNHLISIKKELYNIGKKLLFKPHPDTLILFDNYIFEKNEIQIVDNKELFDILPRCYCVLTEPSTMALLPSAFWIPILLVKFGKLRGLNYGSTLVTYPKAAILNQLTEIGDLVSAINKREIAEEMNQWCRDNIGPEPYDRRSHRIAYELYKLVNDFEEDYSK